MQIRMDLENDDCVRAKLRFWDAQGLRYEREIEPLRDTEVIRARHLPGWVEAMRESVGEVSWTWDIPGVTSPKGRFRVVRTPIAYDEELKELAHVLRDAPRLVHRLLRAKWFMDRGLLEASWQEIEKVRRRHPDEPHAIALAYRALRIQGVSVRSASYRVLLEKIREVGAARRRGAFRRCDIGARMEPLPPGTVDPGCGSAWDGSD